MPAPSEPISAGPRPRFSSDDAALRGFLGDGYDGLAAACRRNPVTASGLLAFEEALSIWTYTTKHDYYRRLNRALRDGQATQLDQLIAAILDRAVRKLKQHGGLAYRGISIGQGELVSYLARHTAGMVVGTRAFTSTSTVVDKAFDGNILMAMWSKNGRLLGPYSSSPEEREVLFPPGTRFRVRGRLEIGSSNWFLELEELGDVV